MNWLRKYCPHCQEDNWVYVGDFDDPTNPDIDIIECWNCMKKWLIDEELAEVKWGTLEYATEIGEEVEGMQEPDEI